LRATIRRSTRASVTAECSRSLWIAWTSGASSSLPIAVGEQPILVVLLFLADRRARDPHLVGLLLLALAVLGRVDAGRDADGRRAGRDVADDDGIRAALGVVDARERAEDLGARPDTHA